MSYKTSIDGICFELQEAHDFSWINDIGRVFKVFDQNDSGNISFGVDAGDKKLFVKYAGAKPINSEVDPKTTISRLKSTLTIYHDLEHPTLIKLVDHFPTKHGYVAVFDWVEGECLHAYWDFLEKPKYTHPESPTVMYRALLLKKRLVSFESILRFHKWVSEQGYVAIDFYDGSVIYDFDTDTTTICDIEFYTKMPYTNTMGRMWGSSRFQSPEEYKLGASIDEVTNVYAMGAFMFFAFGDNRDHSFESWTAGRELYDIAIRAISHDRSMRYQSIDNMLNDYLIAKESIIRATN